MQIFTLFCFFRVWSLTHFFLDDYHQLMLNNNQVKTTLNCDKHIYWVFNFNYLNKWWILWNTNRVHFHRNFFHLFYTLRTHFLSICKLFIHLHTSYFFQIVFFKSTCTYVSYMHTFFRIADFIMFFSSIAHFELFWHFLSICKLHYVF